MTCTYFCVQKRETYESLIKDGFAFTNDQDFRCKSLDELSIWQRDGVGLRRVIYRRTKKGFSRTLQKPKHGNKAYFARQNFVFIVIQSRLRAYLI